MDLSYLRDATRIAVVGRGKCSKKEYELAYKVGALIAKSKSILVCGGRQGIMEAASKGAIENNGLVIGFLPDLEPQNANSFVNIPIFTSLGLMRNFLIVANSDAVIALPGSSGTLSEIAYALQLGKKVITLTKQWNSMDITYLDDPERALSLILQGR